MTKTEYWEEILFGSFEENNAVEALESLTRDQIEGIVDCLERASHMEGFSSMVPDHIDNQLKRQERELREKAEREIRQREKDIDSLKTALAKRLKIDSKMLGVDENGEVYIK